MQKNNIPIVILLTTILFFTSSYCFGQELITDSIAIQKSCRYHDGSYTGQSRAKYTGEPFWGIVNLAIKNDSITEINFMIRDSSLHETFNGNYEKHYQGDSLYMQQCRNDWKGVQLYPAKLSETNNIEKVDAVSGATWSYNIFRSSVKGALNKATKQTDTLSVPNEVK
jgi:major membrane immunogen (membrane-anchored lipoprotein)